MGVFARIKTGLAAGAADEKTITIDATCLKAHRTASTHGNTRCYVLTCSMSSVSLGRCRDAMPFRHLTHCGGEIAVHRQDDIGHPGLDLLG